jgi:hypothetical protein
MRNRLIGVRKTIQQNEKEDLTMINPSAKSCTQVALLDSVSATNTTLGTGPWKDVRTAIGDIMVTQQCGAVNGTVTGTFLTSASANGANNAALVPAGGAFVAANAANNTQKTWIDAGQSLGYLQYVGTIGTGPSLLSVVAHFHNKYSG